MVRTYRWYSLKEEKVDVEADELVARSSRAQISLSSDREVWESIRRRKCSIDSQHRAGALETMRCNVIDEMVRPLENSIYVLLPVFFLHSRFRKRTWDFTSSLVLSSRIRGNSTFGGTFLLPWSLLVAWKDLHLFIRRSNLSLNLTLWL